MKPVFTLCLLVSLLSGCSAQPRMMPTAEFSPIQPIPAKKPQEPTGSIFTNGRELFGDMRSYQATEVQVGDLITVLLSETTQASRSSGVTTSRESTNDAIGAKQKESIINKLGIRTTGSTITSDGAGVAGQTASLTGSISAMVVEVLANGNLIIVGEKQLALTEGSEFIRVKGIIRPADIQPDNTVLSTRIAHAQISYQGTGDLANATTTSWGNKLLYKFWPF